MTFDSEKYKATRHFSNVPRETLSEYGRKAADSKRTPQLRKARQEIDNILFLHRTGLSVKRIAQKYNIPVRSAYRLIRDR